MSEKKITSAIWGTMNTNFKNSSYLKIFFPDPWNNETNLKPKFLRNIFNLPRKYAKNYTNFQLIKVLNSLFNLY